MHIALSYFDDGNINMFRVYIDGLYKFNSREPLNPIPSATNMRLRLSRNLYFKFIRLWNVNMKPYPLMQMRNKNVNYYLFKDKLLFFYDINFNPQMKDYRYIYYNK